MNIEEGNLIDSLFSRKDLMSSPYNELAVLDEVKGDHSRAVGYPKDLQIHIARSKSGISLRRPRL